ncbi:MAG: ImmA/IrrE family metallo-endopeptidase [Actinomycetota bacterium]
MAVLRCKDPECAHEFPVRSQLAEEDDCPDCGGPTELVDPYDDGPLEVEDEVAAAADKPAAKPRVAYARKRARQLLKQHGIDVPPVPVRELANALGFDIVERYSLGSLSGRLVGNQIQLAAGDSEVRKRFTIAHELGHHVLETAHGSGSHAEAEADVFAGELLVPGPQLLDAMKTIRSVDELARIFQVSRPAARIAAEQHRKGGLLS